MNSRRINIIYGSVGGHLVKIGGRVFDDGQFFPALSEAEEDILDDFFGPSVGMEKFGDEGI